MAKKKRLITAGRLVIGVSYSVASLQDGPRARAEKLQYSSAARDAINLRCSCQKLEVILAANFTKRDLFVTLTYDDEHLPASRADAVGLLRRFLGKLRAIRKRRGQTLKYIYVTEQLSAEGGRLHHHLVLSGTGADVEEIRSLWPHGSDLQVDPLEVGGNDDSYGTVAKYMTKEPAALGKAEVGARNWTPSLGLLHPKPETEDMADNETLCAPPEAYILSAPPPLRGEYSEFVYIKYLLPERKEEIPHPLARPPRKPKRRL